MLEEPDQGQTLAGSDPVNQYSGSRISKFISLLTNAYTTYFNLKKSHQGRIFQGPFKSKLISDDKYLYSIVAYINLNPIKHRIVDNVDDWPYLSHHDILSEIYNKLADKNEFIYNKDYKEIIKDNIDKIKNIDLEFD